MHVKGQPTMNKLRIWNPWNPKDPFNQLIEDFPRLSVMNNEVVQMTALDMWEDANNFVVELPVPGLKPDDITLSFDDRYLTISGESSLENTDDSQKKYHVKEMSSISFSRTVLIPGNIDADGIEAKCENGMLKVHLPKLTKTSAKKITVK